MNARAGPLLLARSMRACPLARCAPASAPAGMVRRTRGVVAVCSASAASPAAPRSSATASSASALPSLPHVVGGAAAVRFSSSAARPRVSAASAAASPSGGAAGAGAVAAAAAAAAGSAAAASAASADPAATEQQLPQPNHHYARGPPSDDDYSSSSGSSMDDAGVFEQGDQDDDQDDGDGDPPPSRNPRVEYLGAVDGGAMLTVRGRLTLPLDPPDAVYAVLSDYDRCPEVFSSTVLHARSERQGEPGSRDSSVTVVQGAKWRVLGFSGSFDVRLTVKEDPEARTLVFTLVESAFLKGFEGRWAVRPRKAGGGRGCVVEHVLAVEPMVALPRPIAAVASMLFTRQIDSLLGDLRKEMERQRWHGGGGK